jgi:hypothetical protein
MHPLKGRSSSDFQGLFTPFIKVRQHSAHPSSCRNKDCGGQAERNVNKQRNAHPKIKIENLNKVF